VRQLTGYRFKKCVLHIGTEKTGSTAIQDYLSAHRRPLAKAGALYPVQLDPNTASQWEFAAVANRVPWKQDLGRELGISDAASQDQFRTDFASRLDKQFAANSHADTLLISSEHLQSRLTTLEEIKTLRTYLERWVQEFEIIVYFRRQDKLALSLLSTRLKSAAKFDASNIARVLNSVPKYYEYDAIFERWMSVFGIDAMRPRLYEPDSWVHHDLISDYCATASIPRFETEQIVRNRSLSRKGFLFIQAVNDIYPKVLDQPSDNRRAKLISFIANRYPGKYYLMSRDQAESFYRQFEETNKRLKQLAFSDVQGDLFSRDFSEYPETAEPLGGDYMEAAEIAVDIWKELFDDSLQDDTPLLRQVRRLIRKKRNKRK
jgi:hypothetical protein